MTVGILARFALYFVLQIIAGRLMGMVLSQSANFTVDGKPDTRLGIPKSLPEVWKLTEIFEEDYYKDDRQVYSLVLFSATFLYIQAFSKSGTIYLTILAIHLYGGKAWIFCSLLEAIGCSCSFLLAKNLVCPFVTRLINLDREVGEQYAMAIRPIQNGRWPWIVGRVVAGLRIFPIMPNYLVNATAPMFGVPLWIYFIASLFASLMYNFNILFVTLESADEPDSFYDAITANFTALSCYVELFISGFIIADPISMILRYLEYVIGDGPDRDNGDQVVPLGRRRRRRHD